MKFKKKKQKNRQLCCWQAPCFEEDGCFTKTIELANVRSDVSRVSGFPFYPPSSLASIHGLLEFIFGRLAGK